MKEKTKQKIRKLHSDSLGVLGVIGIFLIGMAVGALLSGNPVEKDSDPDYIPEHIHHYTNKPEILIPINHTIERVEDLFIPFSYENNQSFTFLHTENFTCMSLVLQPDRTGNGTQYNHEVNICLPARIKGYSMAVCDGIEECRFKVIDLQYNQTYTLKFTGGKGVAVAKI